MENAHSDAHPGDAPSAGPAAPAQPPAEPPAQAQAAAEPGSGPPPAGAAKSAPPATLDEIAALIDVAVERIGSSVQGRSRSEAFQQDLITRLHNDLQDQVNRSAVLPVVSGMLRLHEEMEKVADRLHAQPDALTPEVMLRQFSEFAEDLGGLIEQAGVVRFVDESQGDQFNGIRQSVLGRDPTADPALNHRLSARVRAGADFGKTLLRRESVRVYAYDPTLAPAPQPANPSCNPEEPAP